MTRFGSKLSKARRASVSAACLAAALTCAMSAPAWADFQSCLAAIRGDALAKGITSQTYDTYAAPLQPNDVVQFVGAQPEFTTLVWEYLASLVDEERVTEGKAKMREFPNALSAAEKAYGVDAYTVAAVWGVESDFGKDFGKRLILPSLATLSCSGISRAGYFKGEFIAALRIVQEGHVKADHMYGSWAGAFGHTQFMPTTFLRYAVDMEGTGHRDVVDSVPDALGSTANYLRANGWIPGAVWGYEVRVPASFKGATGRSAKQSLSYWSGQGVTRVDDKPLRDGPAALLQPAGADGPSFLVTKNFDAIYSYNASISYALAIAILSDRLRGQPGVVTPWPGGVRGLTRDDRRELQRLLAGQGYDIGTADGVLGTKSRAAIADFQRKRGETADGHATSQILDALRQGGGGTAGGGGGIGGLFNSIFGGR